MPITEIGGAVKHSMGIAHLFKADTSNKRDPTIKPTILHFSQDTGPGHIDWNNFPIRILNRVIDVPRSGQNIDNRTGMNPQGPIFTTILESNGANN